MKKISLLLAPLFFLLASCSNDVDYGELYKKELYIIGSNQNLMYAYHDLSKASPGKISVYCTGSELPDEDIHVGYILDQEKLERFNKNEFGDRVENYFQMVPADKITFEHNKIIVEKGKEYGLLNFTINTEELEEDKLYIVPITLTGAPGYEISETQSSVLYVVSIINPYPGIYNSTFYLEYQDGTGEMGTVMKEIRALNATQLLVPLANHSNRNEELDFSTQYYLLNLNPDNTLTVKPYLQSVVEQNTEKESYYDEENKEFHVYYYLKDNYDQNIYFQEVLKLY